MGKNAKQPQTDKVLTVVIPCYKAQDTLRQALSSIRIQSMYEKMCVILGRDSEDDYTDIINSYPELDIVQTEFKQNGGPGLARQAGLEIVKTPFVTFMDADDVFWGPYSMEHLMSAFGKEKNVVVAQGPFLSRVQTPEGEGFAPRGDPGHPWVFGRIYNVQFLKQNDIKFSKLRSMEDGELNEKIRLLIEGTNLKWVCIEEPVYEWKPGSDHSITRTTWEGRPDIPIYNYGTVVLGSAKCFAQAIEFAYKKNPFNVAVGRKGAELMVNQYFTYYEAKNIYPEYAEQCDYVAHWWYNKIYKKYCHNLEFSVLANIANQHPRNMFKEEPDETFKQWFTRISTDENWKETDLTEIRARLPKGLLELEAKTGCFESFDYEI